MAKNFRDDETLIACVAMRRRSDGRWSSSRCTRHLSVRLNLLICVVEDLLIFSDFIDPREFKLSLEESQAKSSSLSLCNIVPSNSFPFTS
jgi:hypothetical protein